MIKIHGQPDTYFPPSCITVLHAIYFTKPCQYSMSTWLLINWSVIQTSENQSYSRAFGEKYRKLSMSSFNSMTQLVEGQRNLHLWFARIEKATAEISLLIFVLCGAAKRRHEDTLTIYSKITGSVYRADKLDECSKAGIHLYCTCIPCRMIDSKS